MPNGMPKTLDLEKLARASAQPPQATPIDVVRSYFGLSIPDMQALRPVIAPCLCGRCSGFGVQFEVRAHATATGLELISRTDGPPAEPTPEEKTS